MKHVCLLSAILVFFFSCGEDYTEIEIQKSTPIVPQFGEINFSSSYTNEYDFVGKYHNDGLVYVFDKYFQIPRTRSVSETEQNTELENLVLAFCKENPVIKDPSFNADKYYGQQKSKMITKAIINLEDNFSAAQKIFYEQILTLYQSKQISSLQNLVNEINKIEKQIALSNLSEIEKVQLLVSTAVAKYSACYWAEVMHMKTQTSRVKTRTESSSADWLDWFRDVFMPKAQNVLEADFKGAALGAIEGFIFGGAAGSIVPGAGTVTVAITGAVADGAKGAIAGSVVEGIGIHWTWN